MGVLAEDSAVERRELPSVGSWPLAGVLLAGLIIRLWAMRFPPFPNDMQAWIAWGEHVLAVWPWNFYSTAGFADYAPGYLYVTWLIAALKNGLLPNAGLGTYYALYRLPPIIVDLVSAVLIFRIVRRFSIVDRPESLALIGAACHALNPAIIFNSAVWSQIDGIFTFFLLLTIVLLLDQRAEAAVASYVVAFLIKPQSICLAPLIGIVLLMRYPPRRWLRAGIVGLGLGFALLLPFFGLRSFVGLIDVLGGSVEVYPYTSLFTYNIWGVYGMWRNDLEIGLFGLPLRSIGTLLYGVGLIVGVALLIVRLQRSRNDVLTLFVFATYFVMLPVMVMTRMHERYVYPALPLALIVALIAPVGRTLIAATLKNVWWWLWVTLATLHALNLYQVYIYYVYRLTFKAPVPASNWLYFFVDSRARLWSVLTLLIFAALLTTLWLWQRAIERPRAASNA